MKKIKMSKDSERDRNTLNWLNNTLWMFEWFTWQNKIERENCVYIKICIQCSRLI